MAALFYIVVGALLFSQGPALSHSPGGLYSLHLEIVPVL